MWLFLHFFLLFCDTEDMALIGMPEAGRRLGVSGDSAKRSLENAGVPLVRINAKAWAVEEKDLESFSKGRSGYAGRGRPSGSKNRLKQQQE